MTIFAESFITAEVVRAGLTLLPYLVIGFIIMVSPFPYLIFDLSLFQVTFSASSFALSGLALNQMGWGKVGRRDR